MNSIFAAKLKRAPRPHYAEILRSLIGGTLSIVLLLLLGQWSGYVWIMAPFGATCVLLYS